MVILIKIAGQHLDAHDYFCNFFADTYAKNRLALGNQILSYWNDTSIICKIKFEKT